MEYIEEYKTNMESNVTASRLEHLIEELNSTPTTDAIDSAVTGLNDIFNSTCSDNFKVRVQANRTATSENVHIAFDDRCEHLKQIFYDKLNMYRLDKTDQNRHDMVSARSTFKKVIREFKYQQAMQKTNNLLNARVN